MEFILSNILSYFLSLAVNEHSDLIHKSREKRLTKMSESSRILSRALRSRKTLREEVSIACSQLAQDKDKLPKNPGEQALWALLSNEEFQNNFYLWLMSGALPEGDLIKHAIVAQIRQALNDLPLNSDRINYLEHSFFEQLDKAVFSNDLLSHWRHQLSLQYLRNEVASLKIQANEAAGIFSLFQQKFALDQYCDQAFKAWDIIDLTNLPEGDVDIATQNLLVRQLYMPLRISIEEEKKGLEGLEEAREQRRRWEAGHIARSSRMDQDRVGIGQLIGCGKRLVVLGDPGGGKTTMLRWLATAMLLRYRADPAFEQLPDVETLPVQAWIPVLIRCRDLGDADLCRGFPDFLSQHLLKSTLQPPEARIMHALILEKIANNEVLLMVDGLDEITNPQVRMNFCQELERTAARYPSAPIIVTSRIVGYRDMPYRMGKNFQHGAICELDREHKDLFAQRWIEVTEQRHPVEERSRRQRELIEALHASDRIERLTGNPMLLTTLALVKRKVGKLPSRRNKLYAEAVAVLLNWNPGFYAPIDDSEAIPQLEYLAFEMCRRGVQRLTDDEIMQLLEQFRIDHPTVRAAKKHTEQEFLALLEARSSILIKSGSIWNKVERREQAAWEFRHLTFQEYLAAQALLDGRYPGRDKTQPLASQVAPLAGMVRETKASQSKEITHLEAPESWREALRLLVADCKDDDVDQVLRAILTPLSSEDLQITRRTRGILAGLCLADEPNASEEVAHEILDGLIALVDRNEALEPSRSPFKSALLELHRSQWRDELRKRVISSFCQGLENSSSYYGSLWGYVSGRDALSHYNTEEEIQKNLLIPLGSPDEAIAVAAALTAMHLAFDDKLDASTEIVKALIAILDRSNAHRSAAIWALGWLISHANRKRERKCWEPNEEQTKKLCEILSKLPQDYLDSQFWVIKILAASKRDIAVSAIAPFLTVTNERPRAAAVDALAQLGTSEARSALYEVIQKYDRQYALPAARALAELGDRRGHARVIDAWMAESTSSNDVARAILAFETDPIRKKLLSRDLDGFSPVLTRNTLIDWERVTNAAQKTGLPEFEVLSLYKEIASDYELRIDELADLAK